MTSVECPHCHDLRGKGVIGCGAHFMKPSVLTELLSLTSEVKMINLHFKGGGEARNVVEMSTLQRDGTKLTQEIWCRSEDKVKAMTVTADSTTKKFNRTKKEFKGDWGALIQKMIPAKSSNYTFYYPCFMMVETQNWVESANHSTELYAVTNAGKTITENGVVKLDKNGKSLNDRILEPSELVQRVSSGEIPLIPLEEEQEPPEPKPEVTNMYSRY